MPDPGFLPGFIGVVLQTLISKMLELISRAKRCRKELDKLKYRLVLILSFLTELEKHVGRIDYLPDLVTSWINELRKLLEEGSKFVEECTLPHWLEIFNRNTLDKKISQFTADLKEHLDNAFLLSILHDLRMHWRILELNERIAQLRIPASAGDPLPSTPSPGDNIDPDSVQLCFLRLAAFTEEEEKVISTETAVQYWITEGLVAGPDHLRTGQIYINLLADCDLIKPLDMDENGNVHRFRMPQHLVKQIVEEKDQRLGTVRDSQEFSFDDERLYALLKVHIIAGYNLGVRDRRQGSSDLYVVAILGDQKQETRSIKKNLNPRWNETFHMLVPQSQPPLLLLKVYDKDLVKDDRMGFGKVDLTNLAKAASMLRTSSSSSLNTEGSCIQCVDGHMVQEVQLKLENVESGKLYLQIEWVEFEL